MGDLKQVYNPYLPLGEYVPDGEPHVFGDRVYIFGSHDKEAGETFCMLDYVTYSTPVDDLKNWRFEGVIYRAEQDPAYAKFPDMYAPDVVQGNDGRFYLYYCMSGKYGVGGYTNPISVAVADSPAGPYEFLGHVKNADGSLMLKYVCFDPAVMNDEGTIRLYYGTRYQMEHLGKTTEESVKTQTDMFGRTAEDIISYLEKGDNIMGPAMLTLCDDMLTVKEEPKLIIPYEVSGSSFEGHAFFEGSSIRKVNGRYYFVYSSELNHELCYATSDYPDRDFVFGGTIVSNGDVGFNDREGKDRLNMTGTTHGGIECINGEWYVFYHRLTHKTDYSRQACAEKIKIEEDGSIRQVEITSCGLNGGPLKAYGTYPAVIACNITNGEMPHGSNSSFEVTFPNVNNEGEERFVSEITDGSLLGFKYFEFEDVKSVGITVKCESEPAEAQFDVYIAPKAEEETFEMLADRITANIKGLKFGEIRLNRCALSDCSEWQAFEAEVDLPVGAYALYFVYRGEGSVRVKDIYFK